MKYTTGDLVEMFKNREFDAMIHGCNCQKRMKSGIAAQIVNEFPEVQKEDNATSDDPQRKLGSFTYIASDGQIILNAYTQLNYGRDSNVVYVSYPAVRQCFRRMYSFFNNFEDVFGVRYKIGIPKIGAGLANGDWNIISKIIEEEMKSLDVTVVEYIE